jgi:replicative DNA helicase
MSQIDILYFEKVLIKLLFTDKEVQDKVLPFLTEDIFDQFETKQIVKNILGFIDNFSRFPTINDVKITLEQKESYDIFISIFDIDLKEFTKDNLLKEIEDFFKKKLVFHEISNAVEELKEDKLEKINDLPDKLRDAVSFSFKTNIGIDLMESEDAMFEYLHNKDKVISTGIPYFDNMIDGGFHEKSITIYLAESKMGKTLVQNSLAVNSILNNKNVLYVTFELSEKVISKRIISNLMDININELKFLNKETFHKHYEMIRKQVSKKLIIREFPTSSSTANHIRSLLKELKNKMDFVPDIVFLDYMGIMVPNRYNKTENSNTSLKRVCEEIRGLSMEYEGMPIISAHQVNREGFGSAKLSLTDIAESIGIVMTADLIIGITQTEEQRDLGGKSVYSWEVLANRFGIAGLRCTVGVDKFHMRVYPVEQPKKEEQQTTEQKVEQASNSIISNINIDKKEKQKRIIDFE